MVQYKRKMLVAAMGTSPAVLTNTVWELAHLHPQIVPDEIVVFTTKSGKNLLERKLFGEGIWNAMLSCLKRDKIPFYGKLVFGSTSIRVIPDASGNEIDDLRSVEDNLRAADFMLSQLRQYTEDCETELHVSIAGGRKTMSALLFSCMTLLGREQDKVYHVLMPPEFEQGVEPPFFFPEPGTIYTVRATGRQYRIEDAQSELFEIPFVRMRGWYQEKFKTIPPSYRTLVSRVQSEAPRAVVIPEIEIDVAKGTVLIDSRACNVGASGFAALVLFAGGISTSEAIYDRLHRLHNQEGVVQYDWIERFKNREKFKMPRDDDPKGVLIDVAKVISPLRSKLKKSGLGDMAASLVPERGNPVSFPVERIKWRNRKKLSDICGYLFG